MLFNVLNISHVVLFILLADGPDVILAAVSFSLPFLVDILLLLCTQLFLLQFLLLLQRCEVLFEFLKFRVSQAVLNVEGQWQEGERVLT